MGGSAVQGLFYKGGRGRVGGREGGRGETACLDTQRERQGTFWRPHVQATPILPDLFLGRSNFNCLS